MTNVSVMLIVMTLFCHGSCDVLFRIQKGTYSEINLCQNATAIFTQSVRSRIECLKLCQQLLRNNCATFNFQTMKKICSIYYKFFNHKFKEFENGSCQGYQIVKSCPDGFKYLIETNKCIKMILTKFNWSMAGEMCNSLDPRSHLIILNDILDLNLVTTYFKFEVYPQNMCNFSSKFHTYWTAGMSTSFNNTRQPFLWYLYPGVVRSIEKTIPWNPGQPNAWADGKLQCIHSYYELLLHDSRCSFQSCPLCEIEL